MEETFHGFHTSEIPPRLILVPNEEEFLCGEESSVFGVHKSLAEETPITVMKKKRGQRGKGKEKVFTDDNTSVILEGKRRSTEKSIRESEYKVPVSSNTKEKEFPKLKVGTSSRPKRYVLFKKYI